MPMSAKPIRLQRCGRDQVFEMPQAVVDELTYRNYAYNRSIAPEITALEWVRVYGPAALEMEKRYQEEVSE